MAEYYALLARAVGRLQPNNESARREIYTKARNALIQQLKTISPPLSPGDISKQRLELEEAIRRVEREASAPPSATTEAEISRSAARAMEEALGPIEEPEPPALAPPPPPPPPPSRPAPAAPTVRVAPAAEAPVRPIEPRAEEPVRVEPVVTRPPAPPTPAEVRSRAVPPEATEDDEAFSVVVPTPMPAPQPRPTVTRAAAPRAAAGAPRGTQWEDRATADFAGEGEPLRGRAARRAAREAKKAELDTERPRRSTFSRLLLFILILLVLAAGAYAAYTYRDTIQEFFASLTNDEGTTEGDETAANAEGTPADAATPADADAGNGVRVVGPQPADTPAVEFIPTQAVLYENVGDGNLPAYEGTINWAFVDDAATGPRVDITISIPERGMEIALSMQKAPAEATEVSHTIDIIASVPADFPGGGLQSVAQLAAKSSEDAIGTAIVAESQSVPPDYFLLELAAASERQNMSQLRQDWFDLGFVYANGEQAIVTFNKGTEGREVMAQALAAWGN